MLLLCALECLKQDEDGDISLNIQSIKSDYENASENTTVVYFLE